MPQVLMMKDEQEDVLEPEECDDCGLPLDECECEADAPTSYFGSY